MFIAGSILIALILILFRSMGNKTDDGIVLWINDTAVTQEEYQYYEQLNLAESSSYFYSKYQANISGKEEDWDKEYGGEIPREVLRQYTLEDLLEDYGIRMIGKKYGYQIPSSFEEFKKQFEVFNQDRIDKLNAGQVLYGPEQFDFQQYYIYTYSDWKNKIIELISDKLLAEEEEKVKEYYLSLPPEDIVSGFEAELEYYYLLDELPKEEGRPHFEKAINLLKGGKKPEEELEMGREMIQFATAAISKEDGDSMTLAELIQNKEKGEAWISETDQYNGVLVLKEFKRDEIPEFEENQEWAAGQYGYHIFEKEKKDLINQANIRYEK